MAAVAPISLSVLVPVFNEEEGILECYSGIVRTLEAASIVFQIVFVDDGSTDASLVKLSELADRDTRVMVIKLAFNVGQQRAMFTALKYCRGNVVITFDSDLQFHPDCLVTLTQKVLEGYDIVGGIRSIRQDSLIFNCIPSWIGRKLINSALRTNLMDFGAVKAYSGRMVKLLLGMNPPLIVLPAMAYSTSRNTLEIPVIHQPRVTGKSKWSILSRMELYLDIYTLYSRRPFAWMLVGGFFSTAVSLTLGIGIFAYKFFVSDHFSGLIIFFDVFLMMMGVLLFSLSIVGEFVVRGLRVGRVAQNVVVEDVIGSDNQ